MAKKNVEKKENEAVQERVEELYDKQDFIDNAKELGYERYIVVGALFDCDKDRLSKKELDNLVNKFLRK
ncbi:hypothetical protein [Peptostreptococcus sp. D1]|uniref:hypothetical protein n=1 Tax=Peptostreptococcus sp. D1 TaxID=72304 RepID=UPI0008F2C285|nr:hypothetical protein [Peptostreptococcus sp. D1]SFE92052.1 hypothetical protein SAMN02910278_02067 [Peptostreptococcus sp. D1]